MCTGHAAAIGGASSPTRLVSLTRDAKRTSPVHQDLLLILALITVDAEDKRHFVKGVMEVE
jgi:hypothetical protein